MNKLKFIQSNDDARLRASGFAAMVLLIVVAVATTGSSPALAFGGDTVRTPVVATGQQKARTATGGILHESTLYTPSSPVKTDPCLPLLEPLRQSSDTTLYRNNRRPAGQQAVSAVAIGFVLGIRHAPGPREDLNDDIGRNSSADNEATSQSHALSVANYRRCRNELELSLLRNGKRYLK